MLANEHFICYLCCAETEKQTNIDGIKRDQPRASDKAETEMAFGRMRIFTPQFSKQPFRVSHVLSPPRGSLCTDRAKLFALLKCR